ncbi:unnamed protein product [Lymnaea stagnalis]|uniref:Uncharacterized protein n=1 Tax=Lymnaea stagnalis TaxID=6523 RepID=A0AAV2IHQ5_LYMST
MANHKMSLAFSNHRGLMPLSYTDIRRQAAESAAGRLQKILKKHGSCKVDSDAKLTGLDEDQVKLVISTWSYMVQYQDVLGCQLLKYLLRHGVTKGGPHCDGHLPIKTKSQTASMMRIYRSQQAVEDGRRFINHITDVIARLKNAAILKQKLAEKVQLLTEAGYTKNDVQKSCKTALAFMAENLPSQWSAAAEAAWKYVLAYIQQQGIHCYRVSTGKCKNKFSKLPPLMNRSRNTKVFLP